MSCDQCREREAVIHLTQIVNEQVTTLHLCEKCAAEKGVDSPGSAVKTPLGSFLAEMTKGPEQLPSPRTADSCQRCGGSFQDFRETGRLGCSDCYRAFEAPLRDLLRRLHGSTHHLGERYAEREAPQTMDAVVPQGSRSSELREQLRLAVEAENFELAAELRDRLRVME
ncbi:MAG TPA: UvrB/UvrC motif-containing protein [Gemmatimonadales bacterium]|nr:UvrB/UvrC motif-containing protein [Gemmatimonadales bacterium]